MTGDWPATVQNATHLMKAVQWWQLKAPAHMVSKEALYCHWHRLKAPWPCSPSSCIFIEVRVNKETTSTF